MPYPFEPGTVKESTAEPVRVQRARDEVDAVDVIVNSALGDVRERVQAVRDAVVTLTSDAATARALVTALVAEAAAARGTFQRLTDRLTAIEARLTVLEAAASPVP